GGPAPVLPTRAAATQGRTRSRSGMRSGRPRQGAPPSAPVRPPRRRRCGTGRVSPQFTGERLGDPEVVGRGHLEVIGRVGDDLHGQAGALAQLGVVGRRGIAVREFRVGPLDHRSRESLWSLRPPQTVSCYGSGDTLLLDVFDGVGNRYGGAGA